MKRCIITGGTGLIGTSVRKILLANGWECFSLSPQANYVSHPHWHHIYCDFRNPSIEISQLPNKVEAVIHLAQFENFRDFPAQAVNIFNVNTFSTLRILDYARELKAKTFILASSGGIYGYGKEPFKEEQPANINGDIGFYLGTKLWSELIAENYSNFLNVITLRFFFVYGPGQRSDLLIPRLINSVENSIPIILQGKDGILINPIYVDDAANAVVNALALDKSQKINVAGPDILCLRDVGEIIGQALNKVPIFDIQDVQPRHIMADISKMSAVLCKPKVQFKIGIKDLLR